MSIDLFSGLVIGIPFAILANLLSPLVLSRLDRHSKTITVRRQVTMLNDLERIRRCHENPSRLFAYGLWRLCQLHLFVLATIISLQLMLAIGGSNNQLDLSEWKLRRQAVGSPSHVFGTLCAFLFTLLVVMTLKHVTNLTKDCVRVLKFEDYEKAVTDYVDKGRRPPPHF